MSVACQRFTDTLEVTSELLQQVCQKAQTDLAATDPVPTILA